MQVFGDVCDLAAAAGGPISPYHYVPPTPRYNTRRRCGMRGCTEQHHETAGRPYPRPGSLLNIWDQPRFANFPPTPDLATRIDCPPVHELVVPLLLTIRDIGVDK